MFNTVQSLDEKNTALIYKMVLALPLEERWKRFGLKMFLATNKNCLHKMIHMVRRGPSEVIVDWLPLPGSTKRENQWQLFETECVFVCVKDHLEQSCPLHPGLQWHLLGLMHRPPFWQGDEHTAENRAHGQPIAISDRKLILIFTLIIIINHDDLFFFRMVNFDALTG